MKINVRNEEVFASTGGRNFDPSGNVVLFIHGSGQSQLGFMLQHRFFANRGFQCVTPDMPGHGLSKGQPLETIEDMANWYVEFMQTAGIKNASLVGSKAPRSLFWSRPRSVSLVKVPSPSSS